ncbi:MAG TPA: ABC transporter substrate-binding protein, partial [Dehalococcoidia bacterium]|nr:ABC transporter substrate-binding protein [Dehalococcoidia bacterium]
EAEDIKATFSRAVDPATASPNRGALSFIDPAQIGTPDKSTVVFKLNYAYAPFAKALASPVTSWIFPREVLAGGYDPAKTIIGSGPFMLDSVQPDVAYNYKKNPDWFSKPEPHVDGVRIAIIPDTHTQEAQFAAGNLDVLSAPIVDLDAIRQQNPKAQSFQTPNATPSPIYPQEGDPTGPFYDIRVRRAVSMLIDRDALNKALLNGQGVGVAFVPLYMGKWAMLIGDLPKDTQQWYQYNPSEAKKLLDAAGYSNLAIKLAYVTNGPFSTAAYNKLAETLNGMLNQGGIRSSLITQDYNTQYIGGGHGSRQGYFDKDILILAGVGAITDADAALFDNFSSKSTSNGDHLSDPALDAMLDKERVAVKEDDRLKIVQDIERYIADKVYVIPTLGTNAWLFLNPRGQNYQYSAGQGTGTETYAKLWLAK